MGEFHYEGHRIEYDEYGDGDRVLVLVHGLLMNRRMFERLGPALAKRGNRVICVDLLGHGRSDRPEDLRLYSMPLFARQVVALLDHLGARLRRRRRHLAGRQRRPGAGRRATPSGPAACSSRCRCSTTRCPRSRPPSPRSCSACGSGGRPSRLISRLTSALPRTNYLIDIGLDWARQRPGPSLAVLEGLLLGETAPHREERRKITQPTLIVGHPRDPLHPFSDSGMLAEELPERPAGRGELDPRVAAEPEAAERRAGALPRGGLDRGRRSARWRRGHPGGHLLGTVFGAGAAGSHIPGVWRRPVGTDLTSRRGAGVRRGSR